MSDYMFMLENHLSSDQNKVVNQIQAAAGNANANVFLTGGAMRDMLAGFPIRDLDFSVEGPALAIAKELCDKSGARWLFADEVRGQVELLFPGGVPAQLALSRREHYAKAGGQPEVSSVAIQEDLRRRDFSVNAIALSLNRASRGLLLDPNNGLADLERRELRTLSPYTFSDDPSRLLRLIRFRTRLGFTVEPRTQAQYENARAAGLELHISQRARREELKQIAVEPVATEIVKALHDEKLLSVFSEVLEEKANLAGLVRLEKILRAMPDDLPVNRAAMVLHTLADKLTPRERTEMARNLEMPKAEIDLRQKLENSTKNLERHLKSARIRKPSQVYQPLSDARPEEICFLLYQSPHKPVLERIRNYLQKYLLVEREVLQTAGSSFEGKPGSPKYEKAKRALVAARLDHRVRKAPKPPGTLSMALAAGRGQGRRGRCARRGPSAHATHGPTCRRHTGGRCCQYRRV
jgi:tRNA nucleotidyltransferase/poly(A) polymerase